jgi:hypothetical protein
LTILREETSALKENVNAEIETLTSRLDAQQLILKGLCFDVIKKSAKKKVIKKMKK